MTRRVFPALAGIGIGLALVVTALTAIYFSTRNDLLAEYRSSPVCASFADALAGSSCRYAGTATVTNLEGDPGGQSVYLSFPGTYVQSFRATFAVDSAAASLLITGDQVQVEIWRSRVTRVAGADTADNPANDSRPGDFRDIGLLLLPIGVGVTAWSFVATRRLRRGDSDSATPTMGPVAVSDALWH